MMDTTREKPPRWTVARAKERFSELIRAAQVAPQVIYNRDRQVAVVMEAGMFRELAETHRRAATRTLGEAFADLRALCAVEGYAMEVAERTDRPNPFADVLDELSG